MQPPRTLAASWASYDADVVPEDTPKLLRAELRAAFYGGVAATLVLSGEGNGEETQLALMRELVDFSKMVMNGRT